MQSLQEYEKIRKQYDYFKKENILENYDYKTVH